MTLAENEISINRSFSIAVPSEDSDVCMAIRRLDWERINKRLSVVKKSKSKLPIIYSIFFGIAASFGVSIIPLASSEGLPAWVIPLYICVFIFSLITAFVFVYVDNKNKTNEDQNIQYILEDMESVKKLCSPQKE